MQVPGVTQHKDKDDVMAMFNNVIDDVTKSWSQMLDSFGPAPTGEEFLTSRPPGANPIPGNVWDTGMGALGGQAHSFPQFGATGAPRASDANLFGRILAQDSPMDFTNLFGPAYKTPSMQGGFGPDMPTDPTGDGNLDGALSWSGIVKSVSAQTGVPEQIITAVMAFESGGKADAVSPAGAYGLMQVMPFWDGEFGASIYDPQGNIYTGAMILKQNYERYGNWQSAFAAYLGAVDANGNPTTSEDAHGTNGFIYIQRVMQYLQALGYSI